MSVLAPLCSRCRSAHVPGHPQWKCCPTHTSEQGSDWVCDACAVRLHPEKAAIVTHQMPGSDYVLPCCGVLQWEAPQTDRVSVMGDVVTCTGKKRYRPKEETPDGLNRAQRRAATRRQRRRGH